MGQKENIKGLVVTDAERLMDVGKARDDCRKFRIPVIRKYTLHWPGEQLLCDTSDHLK